MNSSIKILYVEDDPSLAFITKYNLEGKGYEVFHCEDGNNALKVFIENAINICLLDVMLPGLDGFSLAGSIRQQNKNVPIIFLTVKSLLEDKITGLKAGADDYLCKPYHLEELHLKIEIFLKRPVVVQEKQKFIIIGKLTFDVENLRLANGAESHQMTLKEATLLQFLLERRNTVVKREEILFSVWGNDDYFLGRSLDVFISRLRKYLAMEDSIKLENIHSVGFRLNVR